MKQSRRAVLARRAWQLGLATLAGVILYLAWVNVAATMQAYVPPRLPALSQAELGDRILVIAPHPDDEALGAAGIVQEALAHGKQVRVVLMTCGDGYRRIVNHEVPRSDGTPKFQALGRIRTAESREAMRRLGLPAGDLLFLGYQETGLAALWSGRWDEPVRGVNEADRVPYPFAYRPGAPADGDNVVADLRSVIASFSPSAVVFPAARDENSDHWATNAFVQHALLAEGYGGKRLEYLVHRGFFPFPWAYLPKNPLVPPKQLADPGVEWVSYALPDGVERGKLKAIEAYRSQRRVMEPYLEGFVRRNELFALVSPVAATSVEAVTVDGGFPGVVSGDASGVTLSRVVEREADITGVAVVRAGGRVWLGMRTASPLGRYVRYRLSVHAFGKGDPRRCTFESVGSKWSERADEASVPPPAGALRGRDRIWVPVPPEVTADSTTLMVEGETQAGAAVVDRTGWRAVSLP